MANVRHDWYQSDQKVVINVLIKNAAEQNCKVDIQSDSVVVHGDNNINLKLDLWHQINPTLSSYKISSVKIEISLAKLIGERWPSLIKTTENEPATCSTSRLTNLAEANVSKNPAAESDTASGSKPKDHKDWDKVVKDIWEKEDLEKAESDAINTLFQKIYSDSNPEIQRAMNKSFTESGGTVLSTNWNEVGAGKVEMKPPTGTEHKNWE